jgi:hypothetical protein
LDHWRSRLSLSGREQSHVNDGNNDRDDEYRQHELNHAFAGFSFGVAHENYNMARAPKFRLLASDDQDA